MKKLFFLVLPVLFLNLFLCSQPEIEFISTWSETATRHWIGPEFWANRLQDWQINNGRLECIGGKNPLRTVHLLTRSIGSENGRIETSVRLGLLTDEVSLSEKSWAGFLIGAGEEELDYRARAIIHNSMGKNAGIAAALDGIGKLVFYDIEDSLKILPVSSRQGGSILRSVNEKIELILRVISKGEKCTLTLVARDYATGKELQKATLENVSSLRITGNIALVSHLGGDKKGASFWFREWKVSGSKLKENDDFSFGPILCVLHSLSKNILKMTVQMPPLATTDPQTVRLEISENGTKSWKKIAEENLIVPGWTVPFRIPEWNSKLDYKYRLIYSLPLTKGKKTDYFYYGTIRHNPTEKDSIVVAGFTGNSNTLGSFGKYYSFTSNRLWFPHADIVSHVKQHNPDLLVFTGDQVYEGRPTAPDRSGEFSSYLDYLYKWYLFCWAYQDLTRDIPTVCMPDDHDVYHGNIWGAGGRKARELPKDGIYPAHYQGGFEGHWIQDGGGYRMPAGFVKMVERTQTSHLPDPYDPTPVEQGIGVYYTNMNYGGISFAILEDRKFKSAPSVVIPAGNVINGFFQEPNFDVRKADVKGAKLLGDRQLEFLQDWSSDWRGAWMKVALSQTILANVSTYPKEFKTDAGTPKLKPVPFGEIPAGYKPAVDMDSNGWPQTGRNKALHELRRGFAFTLAGDQHLGSIVHHGIENWDDAGYSFCVPSIANLWPRRWFPPQKGINHIDGNPPYTGSYFDGFLNRITVWAVSNPYISNQEPKELHDRAPGYGIVRLLKKEQKITMECWPRYADPSDPNSQQYPGWPKTISVADNYGRKAEGFLPELQFRGIKNPVVQVIDESNNDIVYTIRAKTDVFSAKVFKQGLYTIKVGEPGTEKKQTLKNIRSGNKNSNSIKIDF